MPNSIDVLFERLRQFDEITLLELLDITADDLLERFKDKVVARQDILYGEIEVMTDDELTEDDVQEWDGFQFEEIDDDFDVDDFEPGELD